MAKAKKGGKKPKKPKKPFRRKKKVKKKKRKEVLPTLTQQIMGVRRKTPLKSITGFELVRI